MFKNIKFLFDFNEFEIEFDLQISAIENLQIQIHD